jgi:hypothetical protein
LNKLFTKKFLYTFLLNINSFDSEERLIVKIVVFKLYCASVELRKILLEIIEEFILDFNSNREYQITGLVECFDILSKQLFITCKIILLESIYSGLNKPINKKYLYILERTILQTFKNKNLKSFWNNYKTFLISLIKEDNSVLLIVVNFLYKSWPARNPEKICLTIELYENLVNSYQSELVKLPFFKKLTSKIITSIKDLNIIVSDKAMIMFKNDNLMKVCFADFKLGPKIITNLIDNIKNHWYDEIKAISKLVLAKIKNNYPSEVETLDQELRDYVKTIQFSQEQHDELWEMMRFELKAD